MHLLRVYQPGSRPPEPRSVRWDWITERDCGGMGIEDIERFEWILMVLTPFCPGAFQSVPAWRLSLD